MFVRFVRQCGKIWQRLTGHGGQYHTAPALWMLGNLGYGHTCDVYCLLLFHGSSGTRTLLIVMLVRSLPVLFYFSTVNHPEFGAIPAFCPKGNGIIWRGREARCITYI